MTRHRYIRTHGHIKYIDPLPLEDRQDFMEQNERQERFNVGASSCPVCCLVGPRDPCCWCPPIYTYSGAILKSVKLKQMGAVTIRLSLLVASIYLSSSCGVMIVWAFVVVVVVVCVLCQKGK